MTNEVKVALLNAIEKAVAEIDTNNGTNFSSKTKTTFGKSSVIIKITVQ
ncbi:MAG: hypothetical protein K2J20_03990 [Bacilli bacterium]|nr:hypothetical protein [Bacilli bacterium]